MSTEHVEDLLSAYLDNALTQEEQATVSRHLQTCASCNTLLSDYRRFDALLAKQPRVQPSAALRNRIFSSQEFLQLIESMPEGQQSTKDIEQQLTLPQKRVSTDGARHPHLVALPAKPQSSLSLQETKGSIRIPKRRNMYIQRFMQVAIAACLLLTIGVGSFIGWNLFQEQGRTAKTDGITPPQSLQQGGQLPAGMRFVFLKDGGLWSAPEDGSAQALRLTPMSVTVAPHWVVNPAPAGHRAGNLLAYIDTKQGYVHTIRSDGQSDTIIKQLLLPDASTTSWNTPLGQSVLQSLSWSPDGRTLAFVAATPTTETAYLYMTTTNSLQTIAIPGTGTISGLVWSPNGMRVAFGFTSNGLTSILDYNVFSREVLSTQLTLATQQHPHDSLLTLDWTSGNDAPAITWSTGTPGHVHSIWLRHVGTSDNGVKMLFTGDFTLAIYSRQGAGQQTGDWLLGRALSGNAQTILLLNLTGSIRTLASGSGLGEVQWAPDGKHITYFDLFVSGTGMLHSIDTITGVNTLIASAVSGTPAPVWSGDGQHLLYAAGSHTFVVDGQNRKTQLGPKGTDVAFAWSTTSPQMVLIVLQKSVQSIYLVNIGQNTAKAVSIADVAGPIVWTQVP